MVLWMNEDLVIPEWQIPEAVLAIVSLLEHVHAAPDIMYGTTQLNFTGNSLSSKDNQKQFAFTMQGQHTFTVLPKARVKLLLFAII